MASTYFKISHYLSGNIGADDELEILSCMLMLPRDCFSLLYALLYLKGILKIHALKNFPLSWGNSDPAEDVKYVDKT